MVLIGPPNSGKSSFVQALTNAKVEVADYPFTTPMMSPDMVPYEDVLIELVDTPPVTEDYMHGQVLGIVRSADAVAIVADLASDSLIDDIVVVFRQALDFADSPPSPPLKLQALYQVGTRQNSSRWRRR